MLTITGANWRAQKLVMVVKATLSTGLRAMPTKGRYATLAYSDHAVQGLWADIKQHHGHDDRNLG